MVTFKLFAGTNIGLRDNNEDNFIVCPDLTLDEWKVPANQQETIPLGKRGCLVVIADGMGGMNAGEVASDIAIKTAQKMFAPSVLPSNITDKPDSIKAFIKRVIKEADLQVKKCTEEDPTTMGMGSTIIMAWLTGNNVYIGWLGDSRAYSFIPGKGISRLSKDHSYVQQLVDAKILTEEQAMLHPQSNIITRSLGDTTQKAKPDVIEHSIVEGEIILLCSDGLCGVCTDAEISDILHRESKSLPCCKEVLTEAALEGGGSDNITIGLLQIVDKAPETNNKLKKGRIFWENIKKLWMAISIIGICIIGGIWVFYTGIDEEKWPVEKVDFKIQSNILQYGDSQSYNIIITPSKACQKYLLNYNDNDIYVDTISKVIKMKKNKSGTSTIIAISKDDNLKRDSIELILQKKSEPTIVEKKLADEDIVSIIFSIAHNGPLEAGKIYSYSVIINSDIVAKGGYKLTCNNSSIIIDETNHRITIPNELEYVGKCTFTVTPKLKPSKAQAFDFDIKGPVITTSNEELTTITNQK